MPHGCEPWPGLTPTVNLPGVADEGEPHGCTLDPGNFDLLAELKLPHGSPRSRRGLLPYLGTSFGCSVPTTQTRRRHVGSVLLVPSPLTLCGTTGPRVASQAGASLFSDAVPAVDDRSHVLTGDHTGETSRALTVAHSLITAVWRGFRPVVQPIYRANHARRSREPQDGFPSWSRSCRTPHLGPCAVSSVRSDGLPLRG